MRDSLHGVNIRLSLGQKANAAMLAVHMNTIEIDEIFSGQNIDQLICMQRWLKARSFLFVFFSGYVDNA